jgi:NTE family protein
VRAYAIATRLGRCGWVRATAGYAGVTVIAADLHSPDVLVLGGGGILGEAWMNAVLAGLDEAEGFDSRSCALCIGTSAGSIVAAALVAGVAPRTRLGRLPEQPAAPSAEPDAPVNAFGQALGAAADIGNAAAAPLASLALNTSSAGGALLRRAALRRVPAGQRSLVQLGRAIESMGAHWDGRLRIAAVELESGRRVLFGAPDAPDVSVSAAVQASCAIPGVFSPVVAGGHTYVDGGVWSPTNADAAEVTQGSRVLCLNPTGSLRLSGRALSGALGPVSRGVAAAEALALKHRGASVHTINPDEPSVAALGSNLMDASRRGAAVEAGLAQGRRVAGTEVLRAA